MLTLGLLSWLLMGLTAGLLARYLLPGQPRLGWVGALLVGTGGALIGGLIATALGFGGLMGFDPRALLTATLGASLALIVLRTLRLAR